MQAVDLDLPGKTALDIGCGGGLLAEEFSRLGLKVTGIDPSATSLETARAHARDSGLDIGYCRGEAEALPFRDASFDLVYCCDVLEHVRDLDRSIAEAARVLKPGGLYLFDTINRTFLSKIIAIKLLQEWTWSRFVPTHFHVWERFIRPNELAEYFLHYDLVPRGLTGIRPKANPLTLVRLVRRLNCGTIGFGEFGRAAVFTETRLTCGSYIGWAVKQGAT